MSKEQYIDFPCSGCGSCCKRVNKAVENITARNLKTDEDLTFPYKWDKTGRCEKLSEDNQCMVYEDRPIICNVDRMMKIYNMPKEAFFDINIKACNSLMDQDDVPLKFRIR